MPQKKNPDVLELIRGRTARVVGGLTTLLVLIKGLPLAYNRDLQEDKEPLFDAFDTVDACLDLAAVVVDGATLRADRIAARLDEGYPRRHDPDGIPDPAGRPPADRPRDRRPPRRPLRVEGLPPGRPPGRGVRQGPPQARRRRDRDPGRGQRGQGVPVVWLDGPGEVEKQLARWKEL